MKLRVLFLLMTLCFLPVLGFAQDKKPTKPGETAKTTKKMPARDPKTGRFIKSEKKDATKPGKKMPARDPKTGRFIKSEKKDAAKTTKKMPARDPKTGKFIKSEKKDPTKK